jgi:hypothetical protein
MKITMVMARSTMGGAITQNFVQNGMVSLLLKLGHYRKNAQITQQKNPGHNLWAAKGNGACPAQKISGTGFYSLRFLSFEIYFRKFAFAALEPLIFRGGSHGEKRSMG